MTPIRILVAGTGTEVGKTHLTCALLAALVADEIRAVGLKPVETGVRDLLATDQARLSSASFHVKHPASPFHVKPSPYAFATPVSPHLAAREAARPIDLNAIADWVSRCTADVTVIETAGGLFSPLSDTATNFDLIDLLRPGLVVLVAPDRLGVLHDLTATLGLARARGFTDFEVTLSSPAQADDSTTTNARELERLGICTPIAALPRAAPEHPITYAALQPLLTLVGTKLN